MVALHELTTLIKSKRPSFTPTLEVGGVSLIALYVYLNDSIVVVSYLVGCWPW